MFLFSCLLLTIWMPRAGYHKLFSCTFVSGTIKCRVIYALYRLYALDDPLKKYTLSITQPKSIFLSSFARHVLKVECKAWFEIGDRSLDQTWNRIAKITHSLVKLWQGKKHTACRANLNWFWWGSTVILKMNVVLYRVKVQYLLTAIIV